MFLFSVDDFLYGLAVDDSINIFAVERISEGLFFFPSLFQSGALRIWSGKVYFSL